MYRCVNATKIFFARPRDLIQVHRKLYPKDENESVSMKHYIVSVALNFS